MGMSPKAKIDRVFNGRRGRRRYATADVAKAIGESYDVTAAALCDACLDGTLYADYSRGRIEWRRR